MYLQNPRMEIIIQDATGAVVGKVKDDTLYDKECKPICKITPKMTFSKMVRILFMDLHKYNEFTHTYIS